ncbi:unnamed protein product [Cylindrotheca closterium]|uniref:Uncharacterized protein n=1 Tax=Cylindrotheca closterium TaxID=2856 RepID=A0AAD2CQD3_9STRA|nr:unnamed protein product [Cylindrotheca closterium]
MNPMLLHFERVLSRRAVPNFFRTNPVEVVVVAAQSSSSSAPRRCLSSSHDDQQAGHSLLLVDHLEYLDEMLEHTAKMEKKLEGLTAIDAQKYDAVTMKTAGSATHSNDQELIDILFQQAAVEKEELAKQLVDLKNMMMRAQNKTYYAVNSPDGMSDADLASDKAEVDRIIDEASKLSEDNTSTATEAVEEEPEFLDEAVEEAIEKAKAQERDL